MGVWIDWKVILGRRYGRRTKHQVSAAERVWSIVDPEMKLAERMVVQNVDCVKNRVWNKPQPPKGAHMYA